MPAVVQAADSEVMPVRIAACDGIGKFGVARLLMNDTQRGEPPPADLSARFANFPRKFPRGDFAINFAQ